MRVKTDRHDARGIAQLVRLGWFNRVHVKSLDGQETSRAGTMDGTGSDVPMAP
jgi:transposase